MSSDECRAARRGRSPTVEYGAHAAPLVPALAWPPNTDYPVTTLAVRIAYLSNWLSAVSQPQPRTDSPEMSLGAWLVASWAEAEVANGRMLTLQGLPAWTTRSTLPRMISTDPRLSVNLGPDLATTLQELASTQGKTITEVIRDAISMEKFIADELRANSRVLIQEQDGTTKQLLIR